jgi:cobalt/nickel transport system permease protein
MHHVMLDHFAAGATPLHRLDPAAKTVAAVALILGTVLVGRDRFLPLVPVVVALAVGHAVGRMPIWYTVKHLLMISPVAVLMAGLFPVLEPGRTVWTLALGPWSLGVTDAGLVRAANLLAKFFLGAWASLLLLASTRFQDLLEALARLRVPRVFVTQLAFLYRYLWVLSDEMMRLRMARAARDGGAGPRGMRFRSHAGVVGVLFLRTYDRAERIYWAMTARGFDGTLHAPVRARMRATDWLVAAAAVALAAAVVLFDRCVYG